MQSTYIIQQYYDSVNKFNSLKSFQIVLPHNTNKTENEYNDFVYELSNKFTDQVNRMIPELKILERQRTKNKNNIYTDMEKSYDICKFVVHLNQITNYLKPIDSSPISFD